MGRDPIHRLVPVLFFMHGGLRGFPSGAVPCTPYFQGRAPLWNPRNHSGSLASRCRRGNKSACEYFEMQFTGNLEMIYDTHSFSSRAPVLSKKRYLPYSKRWPMHQPLPCLLVNSAGATWWSVLLPDFHCTEYSVHAHLDASLGLTVAFIEMEVSSPLSSTRKLIRFHLAVRGFHSYRVSNPIHISRPGNNKVPTNNHYFRTSRSARLDRVPRSRS